MRYYYNENHGIILFPVNWFDVFRCWLTYLIHPRFKRTWKSNSNWRNPHVIGCIENTLIETDYPDVCSRG